MLFTIRGLSMIYGARSVLDIPFLELEKGVIYAVLGPNGSGKTTLLEILSLIKPPTTGEVKYDDRRVDFRGNNLSALRREIVMVQQNPVLFTTTVHKNLEFGLKIRGVSKDRRMGIIKDSLDLVGMGDFIGSEAHRLSGGETQRVAIARALACSPTVILLDEPTANVDAENQGAIERIMADINSQKGISVIFATHNLLQASKITPHVISLFEGCVISSIYENIFSGNLRYDEGERKICRIQGKLDLCIHSERSGRVRLSIDPTKVRLLGGGDVAFRENIFEGKLIHLADERKHVRATVDIGLPINVIMPKEEARESSFYIGDQVKLSIPKESVRIF
jgi:tungstate transport system ATP-binding protein